MRYSVHLTSVGYNTLELSVVTKKVKYCQKLDTKTFYNVKFLPHAFDVLGHCKYHPEPAYYEMGITPGSTEPVGMYPCCEQKALRFDPTQSNQVNCSVIIDHEISVITLFEQSQKTTIHNQIYFVVS